MCVPSYGVSPAQHPWPDATPPSSGPTCPLELVCRSSHRWIPPPRSAHATRVPASVSDAHPQVPKVAGYSQPPTRADADDATAHVFVSGRQNETVQPARKPARSPELIATHLPSAERSATCSRSFRLFV